MTAGNKRFTAVVAILFLLALVGLTGCTEPKQTVGFPVAHAISGGAGGIAPAENMTVVPAAIWEKALARPDMMAYAANFRYYADKDLDMDISADVTAGEVPLLLQWDKRWGYEKYGDGMIAFTGCAPTCLSMVSLYLTNDTSLDPLYIANRAEAEGYYVEGVGSDWSVMTIFAEELGLDSKELPLDKNTVIRCLESGEPIICAMGPGDFTENGHFILLSGVENGKIKINDPNSIANSKKLWEFEDISRQIKNLWRYKI